MKKNTHVASYLVYSSVIKLTLKLNRVFFSRDVIIHITIHSHVQLCSAMLHLKLNCVHSISSWQFGLTNYFILTLSSKLKDVVNDDDVSF